MAQTSDHIINRTRLEVRLSQDEDALNAPSRWGDFFHHTVQPALDQALTLYAADDRDYRIEHLEIDLGPIDILHPGPAIAEKIKACVVRALQGLEPLKIQVTPPQKRIQEGFLAYLRTGQIPWFGGEKGLADLEADIRESSEAALGQMFASLRPMLRHRDTRLRLVQQFSCSFVEWLVVGMQPGLTTALVETAAKSPPGRDPADRTDILLRLVARLPRKVSRALLRQTLLEEISVLVKEKRGREIGEGSPRIDSMAAKGTDKDLGQGPARGQKKEDRFLVRQAGVVLLHPFLPRFFDRCGLLRTGKDFKDLRSREKAVHLLHLLATGQDHPEEPQTGVYKILCGLDVIAPVPRSLDLAPEDRDEALRLLQSAIDHWSRLKSTSPDGLRIAFLQRQGILTRTDDGWRLTVEQQSIDILLDTLPWNLSVIRLPWLKKPVRVDWG